MRHLSLRTKLLLVSIVLALIPLGIAGRTMIDITRNELKSNANGDLLQLARDLARELDDLYQDTWTAPLLMIRNAVDNEELGIQEKLGLLNLATSEIRDLASLQLTVRGASPAIITQTDVENQLAAAGLDPLRVLQVSEELAFAENSQQLSQDAPVYLPEVDEWLLTLHLPLKNKIVGRDAVLSARLRINRIRDRLIVQDEGSGTIILINDSGDPLLVTDQLEMDDRSIVDSAVERLTSGYYAATAEPYERADGEKMLGAYAISSSLKWAVIAERRASDAYLAVSRMTQSLMFWIFIGAAIAVIGAVVVAWSITYPLRKLTSAANELATGNLTTQVEGADRGDEIGVLSTTFNKMVTDLNRYIEELTETTKEKERAESELNLARNIQQGFLPTTFPTHETFEFYGRCDPAREVGGDYFDYFQIDDQHMGFVIGDVSGKGVPAALFMAVSRTLFHMLGRMDSKPDAVLSQFNNWLVQLDPSASLFITIFYGVLNTENGSFIYSSAGHNMPFQLSVSTADGFTELPRMKTMVAGMFEDIPLEVAEITLHPGDMLALYTDGMTEAINENNEEFGTDKLQQVMDAQKDKPLQEFCDAIFDEVNDFQKNMPQFDDMTFFAVRMYK